MHKRYPKKFCEETVLMDGGFAKYRHRNDGRKMRVRKYEVDNIFVVPYSKYLIRKFNAHINVEICSTIHSVKYLFLYLHKGHA